jgi:hypothetical protein
VRAMRPGAVLLATALLTLSCGGSTPSAVHSPSPKPSASAVTSSEPSPAPLTGPYGLILSAGTLMLIKPDGGVAGALDVAPASTQYCSPQRDTLVAPPPVSASSAEVYFRDGDTKIRKVVLPNRAVDVTTVPSGPNIVSFFSVSPDDQQIAVLVVDVSSSTALTMRLYVEDLNGGGHHVDIYSTQTAKDDRAFTLWPMGWHAGTLVLAKVPGCTFTSAAPPSEWHVSRATDGTQLANIKASNCTLSYWPSAAGVACIDPQGVTTRYDWAGKGASVAAPGVQGGGFIQAGLSPTGNSVFFATGAGAGASTRIVTAGVPDAAAGHSACLFIDERTLLSPDAVITLAPVGIKPLAQSGVCAGRFPGGL